MKDLYDLTFLRRPSQERIAAFRAAQEREKPNYSASYRARKTEVQSYELSIGRGRADFEKAKGLIQQWGVFDVPEGIPYPPDEAPAVGQTTVNLLRELGIWFLLACRITDVQDKDTLYGFTFETLSGHVEVGWENFSVRYIPGTEEVRYSVRSESTHRFLLMRMGGIYVHYLQRRYKRNSAETMLRLMQET